MRKLTRRSVLAAAAALAAKPAGAIVFHPATGAGASPPHGNLTAEITFPGGVPVAGTLVFDQSTATDMGDYVAPTAGFTQHCYRARNASLPNFFVDFRPDAVGGRVEVVFWNGETLGTVASGHSRNLPAYNAVVKQSGVALGDWRSVTTTAISYHYWGNRWRFQTALRPYIRTASQVFSGGFLPNMSLAAARLSGYSGVIVPGPPPVPSPSTNDGQNGNGSAMTLGANGYLYLPFMTADDLSGRLWGIQCAGDTGGYRDDQGLTTKWQADWLLNGTASSLNTFMQQAEFFSCQENAIYSPDQTAGGPVNQKSNLTRYEVTTIGYGGYYQVVTGGYGANPSSGGFNGTVSGTTLTVTSPPANGNVIASNWVLKSYASAGVTYDGIPAGTYIVSQLTGTPGGVGTYQLSKSVASAPAQMITFATTGEYQSKGDEHSPQLYYIPWVITEDPFYLEGAQYHENYATQQSIFHKDTDIGNLSGDPTGLTGINGAFTVPVPNPGIVEERATGWGVKNIASCYKMSPASPPSWLLPQSYWAALSSDFSRFIDWQIASWPTDQYYTVFNSFALAGNSIGGPQTFYKAYSAYAFGFADLVGLPVPAAAGHTAPSTWFNQLTYIFDAIRKITDSTLASGWNVQTPLIHDIDPSLFWSNQGGPPSGCVVGTSTTGPSGNNCVSSYSDLWTYCGATLQDSTPYPSNPSPGYIGRSSTIGNLGPLYAACAVAKSRSIVGAANCMNFISSMIDFSYPQTNYDLSFNTQDGFTGT